MALTRGAIEAMAPDQAALKAASALLKPAKWPLRARADGLIWGECQGSGANPYRVCADTVDLAAKCTCPSRKFPCKHGLALLWLFVDDAGAFAAGAAPDWVGEWMGRRRKGGGAPAARAAGAEPKSLQAALAAPAEPAPDPQAEARRKAQAARRAAETRQSVLAATEDLETWIADQLRTGLAGFLDAAGARCRGIAARLVDGKAGALAGRVDEMPARLLALSTEARAEAAIAELGKLVLLARAWRADPDDPELRREVIGAETREELLGDPRAVRIAARWEVLGERIVTRRDGLVGQSTWLLNLGAEGPPFALLADFFPASAGRRSGAFRSGECFAAELAFYPAGAPLRAVIAARGDSEAAYDDRPWPAAPGDPFVMPAAQIEAAPWRIECPLLLPAGRICAEAGGRTWWRGEAAWMPLAGRVPEAVLGLEIVAAAGIWDGMRLAPLAAQTDWGRIAFDA